MKADVLAHLFSKEEKAAIAKQRESLAQAKQPSGSLDRAEVAASSVMSSASEQQGSLFTSSRDAHAAKQLSHRRGSTAGLEGRSTARPRMHTHLGVRRDRQDDAQVADSIGK